MIVEKEVEGSDVGIEEGNVTIRGVGAGVCTLGYVLSTDVGAEEVSTGETILGIKVGTFDPEFS